MADGLTQTNEIASKTQREQERDGAKPNGLTQTNEIASKSQREIQSYLDNFMTDKQTNELIKLVLKSQLKSREINENATFPLQ